MAVKEISVKKYVVRLSGEERAQLEGLINKGKGPAQRLRGGGSGLNADLGGGHGGSRTGSKVASKPGNAGGGKGPHFWRGFRSSRGRGDWR